MFLLQFQVITKGHTYILILSMFDLLRRPGIKGLALYKLKLSLDVRLILLDVCKIFLFFYKCEVGEEVGRSFCVP